MSDFYHISRFKPEENGGGVEQFASYLRKAVPDLELISFSDFPQSKAALEQITREYELAENLNHWLLDTGALNESSTVIVDGYWGLGLQGKVGRLISVCHGAYWGRFAQAQVHSWGEVVMIDDVDAQTEMWESPGVEVVCVAPESNREVLYSCSPSSQPVVICNGVDTDVLCPIPDIRETVWMHAATSMRKGLREIAALSENYNMRIEVMGACRTLEEKARRLNEAVVFVSPTHHEGNSYVLLEAMACGVPIVTYATGIFDMLTMKCGVVTDDLAPENLARILRGFHPEQYDPRAWVLENATWDKFAREWREFLGV